MINKQKEEEEEEGEEKEEDVVKSVEDMIHVMLLDQNAPTHAHFCCPEMSGGF